MVLDQMCTDRRLLLVDLIRCLLLRGMAVPEVKKAITAVPAQPVMVAGVDVVWIDVEIAERKLHLALRKALADVEISEAVQELLSIHYLRLRLHHDELDGIQEGSLPLEAAKSGMPTSNAYSA